MNTQTQILYRPFHKTRALGKGLLYGASIIVGCWAATVAWHGCCSLAERAEKGIARFFIDRQLEHGFTVDAKGTVITGRKMSLDDARKALVILKEQNEDLAARVAEAREVLNLERGF